MLVLSSIASFLCRILNRLHGIVMVPTKRVELLTEVQLMLKLSLLRIMGKVSELNLEEQ